MAQKYASFAAKDTRENNSLPSDFDAAIIAAQFSKEAPDNYNASGNPIFGWVTYLIDEAGDYKDKTEEERTLKQSYNLGAKAGDEFDISDDGFGLIPKVDGIASTRKGSKFDIWKCTLEGEGVPQTITEQGDLSKFVGMRGHWRRVEDEKLTGKKRNFNDNRQTQKKGPDETLVMVKLLALPGEKGKTATSSKGASAPASAPAGAGEFDLDTATTGYLMDVLASAKDNQVQRSQLIALLSKAAIKDTTNRSNIARRGQEEDFLKTLAESGVVIYDPAGKPQVVKLAA